MSAHAESLGLSRMGDENDDELEAEEELERVRYSGFVVAGTDSSDDDEEEVGEDGQGPDRDEGFYQVMGETEAEGEDGQRDEEEFPYEEVFGDFESYEEVESLSRTEPLDFLERDYVATMQSTRLSSSTTPPPPPPPPSSSSTTTTTTTITTIKTAACRGVGETPREEVGVESEVGESSKKADKGRLPPPPPSIPPLTQDKIASIKNIMMKMPPMKGNPRLGVDAIFEAIQKNPPRLGDELA